MATTTRTRYDNAAELRRALGGIPLDRICLDPPPGTATERNLLAKHGRPFKLYELVDGTLVEKAMGSLEAFLAIELSHIIRTFLDRSDLGFLYGADALIRLMPRVVRGPDVSFVSWRQRPERTVPMEPISDLVPDFVVEILSQRNTKKEIQRKIAEYFEAGVRLAWVIDPRTKTATVYHSPTAKTAFAEADTLDGGTVLPGFELKLATLFEKLAKPESKRKPRKK